MKLMFPSKVVIYGGTSSSEEMIQHGNLRILNDFYIFNVQQAFWEEAVVGGNSPHPRMHCTLSVNFPQLLNQNPELILFAGSEEVYSAKIRALEPVLYVLGHTGRLLDDKTGRTGR
jgi:hypothetical protein